MSDKEKISFEVISMLEVRFGQSTIIELSPTGGLVKFDNKICREVASIDYDEQVHDYQYTAKLCIELLESAASKVDHILKEGGGTYGDIIRNMSIDKTHIKRG